MSTKNDVAVVKHSPSSLIDKRQPVATVTPAADIYETDDAYVLMLDLPGGTKESISITMDQSSLEIRSTVETTKPQDAKVLYNEIHEGSYYRSFNLTDGINRESVDARFENGVLTIKLFKKEELKSREIQIR